MDSGAFIQLTINGLLIGIVYALFGVSLTFVWRLTGVPNLIIGEIVVSGALITYLYPAKDPIVLVLVYLPALLLASFLGFLLQRHLFSRINDLIQIILFMLVLKLLFAAFSQSPMSILEPDISWRLGQSQVIMTQSQLTGMLIALLILCAFMVFYYRSRMGREIRAVSENLLAARFLGIDIFQVYGLGFGIGVLLALLSGILLAPLVFVDPADATLWTLKGFAIVAVAGIRSIWATLIASVMLALFESYTLAYIGPGAAQAFILIVTVGLLLTRLPSLPLHPQGLT